MSLNQVLPFNRVTVCPRGLALLASATVFPVFLATVRSGPPLITGAIGTVLALTLVPQLFGRRAEFAPAAAAAAFAVVLIGIIGVQGGLFAVTPSAMVLMAAREQARARAGAWTVAAAFGTLVGAGSLVAWLWITANAVLL